uniref:Iron-sulfur cluster-binding protein n=1 Tax=Chlorobium chlorochromatii (strain CaD3) TaxID=340177 RepID=Q3ATZ4_CHLCH
MTTSATHFVRHIRAEAARIGFVAIGFAAPELSPMAMQRYMEMLHDKRHGEMAYLANYTAERANPTLLLSDVKTVISVALSYNHPITYCNGFPKISRYALIDDYHTVMKSKLEELHVAIERIMGEPIAAIAAVDSAPLLEKSWAEQAGIGKVGKNSLLKIPSAGSFVFLGELLIDKEIRVTPLALPNYCGSCNACIEHCPTGALLAPSKLDATKCISYLTIELKRDFTADEAAMIGEWLFGCDICQEVCPYNRQASIVAHSAFTVREELLNVAVDDLLGLTKSSFRKLFYGTPVFRIGLRRLKRNARAVEENVRRRGKNDG